MDVITFPENLYLTSGLSISLHGVITLPHATAYDKAINYCLYLLRTSSLTQKTGKLTMGPKMIGK